MELTIEEIQALAQLERDMDSGKQAFVVTIDGTRCAFDTDLLNECGVHSGQTVSDLLLRQLMLRSYARLQTKILLQNRCV